MQNPRFIKPWLHPALCDDDLPKEILDAQKRPKLRLFLLGALKGQGGLDIILLYALIDDKINLTANFLPLPICIRLKNINCRPARCT